MEHNKTSGLDGFPMVLSQNNWDVIKVDLMAIFSQLHSGDPQPPSKT